MEKILIDTDIIIDFLRGYHLRTKSVFSKIKNLEIKAYISLISVIELYAGIEEDNNQQEVSLKQLLSLLEILPIDFNLSRRAGSLRRKYRRSIADSVIAAVSSYYKIKLFTFNLKHFQNIPEVDLYHPDKQF